MNILHAGYNSRLGSISTSHYRTVCGLTLDELNKTDEGVVHTSIFHQARYTDGDTTRCEECTKNLPIAELAQIKL